LSSSYNKANLTSAPTQQLTNFYLEKYPQESANGRPNVVALPTPGCKLWYTIGSNAIRPGGLLQHKGFIYAVSGNSVYKLTVSLGSVSASANLGTIGSSTTGNVIIAAIDNEIVFCSVPDQVVYSYRTDTGTWA